MKMDLGARLLSNGLGITLVAIGGIAFAQGMGKLAPGTHLNPVPTTNQTLTQSAVIPPSVRTPATLPKPLRQSTPSNSLQASKVNAARKRVISWFTRYDQIRHQAQMTPEEKANAHTLMTAALTNNDDDKQSGKQLLTKMVSRYAQASSQLKRLKPIPETAALQKGYEQYFKTGHDYFSQYLHALNSNQALAQMPQMEEGRQQLGVLDVANKALDKRLRKEFNIAPYRWD